MIHKFHIKYLMYYDIKNEVNYVYSLDVNVQFCNN